MHLYFAPPQSGQWIGVDRTHCKALSTRVDGCGCSSFAGERGAARRRLPRRGVRAPCGVLRLSATSKLKRPELMIVSWRTTLSWMCTSPKSTRVVVKLDSSTGRPLASSSCSTSRPSHYVPTAPRAAAPRRGTGETSTLVAPAKTILFLHFFLHYTLARFLR